MKTGHRDNRPTTLDLMATLALIALGLFAIRLVLPSPSIETQAVLCAWPIPRTSGPTEPTGVDFEAFVQAIRHSPQNTEDIRDDPALSTWSSSLSAEWLRQKLRQDLRVRCIPGTPLLAVAIRVDDRNRDTAILNVMVNTFVKTHDSGKYQLIDAATPPRLSTPQAHFRIVAAYLVSVPILSLIALMVVRRCKGFLLDRRARAFRLRDWILEIANHKHAIRS